MTPDQQAAGIPLLIFLQLQSCPMSGKTVGSLVSSCELDGLYAILTYGDPFTVPAGPLGDVIQSQEEQQHFQSGKRQNQPCTKEQKE